MINKKSGFSLLEMIMVIIIAGIIYRTVVDNVANTLDSARKNAFLDKMVDISKIVCNSYKSDNRLNNGNREFYNHYNPANVNFHNRDYDNINVALYTDLGNQVLLNTYSGWTEPSNSNNISYRYRNGECLTVFYLSKILFNNQDFLSNSFKSIVTDVGDNWEVTLITFEEFDNNLKDKHLLNVRNNIYRDRKKQGTFNNTDLSGNDIQTARGFIRNNTNNTTTTFNNADTFNEVNDDSIISNSYLYQADNDGNPLTLNKYGSNRINDDNYNSNLIKPVRFNNNNFQATKDGISPLRKRENNLKVVVSKPSGNNNGYLSNTNPNSGYIPGGRGFTTCKQDALNCYNSTVTPSVDSVGIKVIQP